MNQKISLEQYYKIGYSNGLSGNNIPPDEALAQFKIPSNKFRKAKSSYIDGFTLGRKVSGSLYLFDSYNNGVSLLKVRKNEKNCYVFIQ